LILLGALVVFLGLLIEMTCMARALVGYWQACSAMYAVAAIKCCRRDVIWSPAFSARRPATWLP